MVSMQEKIEKRLIDVFEPSFLEIKNMSHLHAGHAGDDGSGESHFSVKISSDQFLGVSKVASHRLIYKALGPEMLTIHALQIDIRH